MRWALLVLAACAGSPDLDDCPLISDIQTGAGTLSSGQAAIAVTWTRQLQTSPPEHHGVMVFADGTVSPDIAVDGFEARGVTGTRTVLWLPTPKAQDGLEVTLGRTDSNFFRTVIAPLTRAVDVTFDGTSYQLFWATPTSLHHQSLSEDGVLGPIHDLAPPPPYQLAAASGDGLTLVAIDDNAYFIDTASGALTHALAGAAAQQTFFFAGQFHFYDGAALTSLTPGGAVTRRPLTGQLANATRFYATANTLAVESSFGVFEVGPDLAVTKQLAMQLTASPRLVGLLGSAFVELRHVGLDFQTNEPGHVDVISPTWRVQLDQDSPVRSLCDAR